MAEHPKPPASSTERTSDEPGKTRPGAQALIRVSCTRSSASEPL